MSPLTPRRLHWLATCMTYMGLPILLFLLSACDGLPADLFPPAVEGFARAVSF